MQQPKQMERDAIERDTPERAEQDWDDIEGAEVLGDALAPEGGLEDSVEQKGALPEEDDDNPDQESDEALPDDEDEAVMRREMSSDGSHYEPE